MKIEMKPDLEISIAFEDDAWPKGLENIARQAIFRVVKKLEIKIISPAEISILLTNDEAQKSLNKQFRKIDKPTNVLSFAALEPFSDISGLIGDISLAYETLNIEAKNLSISFEDHFTHLIVHGFLHLLGYDHQNDEQAQRMENLEVQILSELNIKSPY